MEWKALPIQRLPEIESAVQGNKSRPRASSTIKAKGWLCGRLDLAAIIDPIRSYATASGQRTVHYVEQGPHRSRLVRASTSREIHWRPTISRSRTKQIRRSIGSSICGKRDQLRLRLVMFIAEMPVSFHCQHSAVFVAKPARNRWNIHAALNAARSEEMP